MYNIHVRITLHLNEVFKINQLKSVLMTIRHFWSLILQPIWEALPRKGLTWSVIRPRGLLKLSLNHVHLWFFMFMKKEQKNSYQMYFYSVVANKATIFRFDWKWSYLRCTGTCNISHKLLRSRQFLGKFQEILEWFTLQKSQAPPLTKCCGIWEE